MAVAGGTRPNVESDPYAGACQASFCQSGITNIAQAYSSQKTGVKKSLKSKRNQKS